VVRVPVVGGCRIGARPVDFHISALEAMGAEIGAPKLPGQEHGSPSRTLHLPTQAWARRKHPHRGFARQRHRDQNAAVEPEIIDTILFLQKWERLIRVDVDRRICRGVTRLRGATHHTLTDRVEVASLRRRPWPAARQSVARPAGAHHPFSERTAQVGGFEVERDAITFFRETDALRATHVERTSIGLSPTGSNLRRAFDSERGVSVIHETVYETRFGYTNFAGHGGQY
jgi:UDP-N-acetylglucosamine 1-carboxyvinyltransferase